MRPTKQSLKFEYTLIHWSFVVSLAAALNNAILTKIYNIQ